MTAESDALKALCKSEGLDLSNLVQADIRRHKAMVLQELAEALLAIANQEAADANSLFTDDMLETAIRKSGADRHSVLTGLFHLTTDSKSRWRPEGVAEQAWNEIRERMSAY